MIIDCHGHFTTVPKALHEWRRQQLEAPGGQYGAALAISDDELREALESKQLKVQRERGLDMTLFSPIAGQMGHHLGTLEHSIEWSTMANDVIHRVCELYPQNFTGVCQLPQSPGADLGASVRELERCVTELGFVGCNLNPDPSGGYWTDKPLTDRIYYPLYEKMVELDVPAMIHVSSSCNPCFHHVGAHYLNGDTTAFMQFLLSPQLFEDFPTLRFVIPHGGGAVPYHWGRYRGLAQDMGFKTLDDGLMKNIFFDTCVYHQAGVNLLAEVVPHENILFGSEMIGAVKGIDPTTGHHYDDTRRYIAATPNLCDCDRKHVFYDNALAVYPRLKTKLA
ncbi:MULTISPECIES: amidohydrolase family protein [unclassified Caballeronia]|uniref:amidohydrolase family protein n=1 Tax=unclassified Caballeronia TaxID=2646786 RepID=UPI00285462FF|nr:MULTISPECIES: amidohydrolase family protein [unclassified Caballeronia]MDR5752472.1 amidohydrolase family protein [Caballeronia sp. LZ024]MDR5845278.1 amidohydrolase family protein [Caballeronia sp. LZ031]